MKLDNKLMLKLLKEEYDKRINYYLGEVETKTSYQKEDGELVAAAHGLKVKDRAGNVFVIDKIVKDENNNNLVYLIPPGEKDEEMQRTHSSLPMYDNRDDVENVEGNSEYLNSNIHESDDEEENSKDQPNQGRLKSGEIIKPNPKAKVKKSFKIGSDINKIKSYDEVDGRVIITLKDLEKDFTL